MTPAGRIPARVRNTLGLLGLLALLCVALSQSTRPVPERVIASVRMAVVAGATALRVSFAVPVRVEPGQLPAGAELLVRVAPTVAGGPIPGGPGYRETLTWAPSAALPLNRITFRRGRQDESGLGLSFERPVRLIVHQDDALHLTIRVENTTPSPLPPSPHPVRPTPAVPVTAPAPRPQVAVEESKPSDAMELTRARDALARGDYDTAIRILSDLTGHEGDSQERAWGLLGQTYAAQGDVVRAADTLQGYLRRFPDGAQAEALRQRLGTMRGPDGVPTPEPPVVSSPSIQQAQPQTSPPIEPAQQRHNWQFRRMVLNSARESGADSADAEEDAALDYWSQALREPGRGKGSDAPFGGSFVYDLPAPTIGGPEDIKTLFFDAGYRPWGLTARVGRQAQAGVAWAEAFDGALMNYRLNSKWRLSAVAGLPLRTGDTSTLERHFYGLSIQNGGPREPWESSLYAVRQVTEGITDRAAVGAELHLNRASHSLSALADYDVSYRLLNTFLLLGEWRLTGVRLNLGLDYHKTPRMSTSNALRGTAAKRLSDLLCEYNEDQLRQFARDRTATARSVNLGATVGLAPHWKLSGEAKRSSVSATPASGGVAATAGTGSEYSYLAQISGQRLWGQEDVSTIGVRYRNGRSSDSTALTMTSIYPLRHGWRANPRMRVEHAVQGPEQATLYKPSLRLSRQRSERWKLEVESGMEWHDSHAPVFTTSPGYFISLGYTASLP